MKRKLVHFLSRNPYFLQSCLYLHAISPSSLIPTGSSRRSGLLFGWRCSFFRFGFVINAARGRRRKFPPSASVPMEINAKMVRKSSSKSFLIRAHISINSFLLSLLDSLIKHHHLAFTVIHETIISSISNK